MLVGYLTRLYHDSSGFTLAEKLSVQTFWKLSTAFFRATRSALTLAATSVVDSDQKYQPHYVMPALKHHSDHSHDCCGSGVCVQGGSVCVFCVQLHILCVCTCVHVGLWVINYLSWVIYLGTVVIRSTIPKKRALNAGDRVRTYVPCAYSQLHAVISTIILYATFLVTAKTRTDISLR